MRSIECFIIFIVDGKYNFVNYKDWVILSMCIDRFEWITNNCIKCMEKISENYKVEKDEVYGFDFAVYPKT